MVLAFQLSVIGAFLLIIAGAGLFVYLNHELSDAIDTVVAYQGQGPGGTPRVYDRYGTLLFEITTVEKRRWLTYGEMPEVIKQATVAVEDDTYWTNYGFDPAAIGAAFWRNYRQQENRPVGASTITQQLVRFIAFDYEERIATSYERKAREVFLAAILTQRRSKEDILTMYLNEIYYGNLAYGIEAAAQTYFGKPAADLSLAEAAFLAGLPQAPADLDPYRNLVGALERQRFILELMRDDGLIDDLTYEVTIREEIALAPPVTPNEAAGEQTILAPHFVLYVQQELEARYGPDAITRGGWQITTTLDLRLQQLAESAAREWVAQRIRAHDVNNAAVIILKPGTGEILTMVGSLDYFNEGIDGQVNVALQPRQPGSSIKPITYAAAMERGWTTGDVIWDVPILLDLGGGEKMRPVNYDNRYHGPLLLRDALANSYNIPPIQLIRDIGVETFIGTARRMGVDSLRQPPGYYGLALTLGGGEVPLLEMTHAYATLATGGQRPQLSGVLRIEDSRGRTVFDAEARRVPPVNAISQQIAYIITDILDDDAARRPAMGYGNALELPFPAAAKTGTTNDYRDNWTLGYTPGVVIGVWLGNTDGHPMINSSGLVGAAPLWRTLMLAIHDDPRLYQSLYVNGKAPAQEFIMPRNIEEKSVCLPQGTGGATCSATRSELFIVGGPTTALNRLGYMPDKFAMPGAWQLTVLPFDGVVQQTALDDGTLPPAPGWCVVSPVMAPEGAATRLFLPIPPFYPDEVRARVWAQGTGYQMAPPTTCRSGLARAGGAGGGSSGGGTTAGSTGGGAATGSGSTARITSPTPGQTVSSSIAIVGSAQFDPAAVQYYKLEIGRGATPTEWTTFGTTHSQPVAGGVLETLQAGALSPGEYVIRLVLVENDGNFAPPFTVRINVAP